MDTRQLRIETINQFIDSGHWDDAFEWVKDEVHEMTPEGALLTTKLVKRTKWYDQGLALLSLNKDESEVYMEEYLKVCTLQKRERSRLSLWSKIPGPSPRDDLEDSISSEADSSEADSSEADNDSDLDDSEEEDEIPLAESLELELIMEGISGLLTEKIDDYDQKSTELPHILEVTDQKVFQNNCCSQLQVPG